jgi:hypothetical protein
MYPLDAPVGESRTKLFLNEFNPFKIKASIAHEISHWIRNSETEHIDKLFTSFKNIVDKTPTVNKNIAISKAAASKVPDVVGSDMELDAYVHGIAKIKSDIGDSAYNKLTLADLYSTYNGLTTLMDKYRDWYNNPAGYIIRKYSKMPASFDPAETRDEISKLWKEWQRRLVNRLSREDLLGDNMRRFVPIKSPNNHN